MKVLIALLACACFPATGGTATLPPIVPLPKTVQALPGAFSLPRTPLVLTDDPSVQAVADVVEALAARGKRRLSIRRAGRGTLPPHAFALATLGSPLARQALAGSPSSSPAGFSHSEGYRLTVTPQRVVIVGHDAAGTFYGAQTLLQLLAASPDRLPAVQIDDWPDFPVRAAHICLFRYDDRRPSLPYLRAWFGRLAPRAKLNTVIVQVDSLMQYHTHPELSRPNALTQAEMRALVAYGRRRHLTLIPHLQCLSHQYSLLGYGHPELLLERKSETYNPRDPRVLPILADLMGELLDVFGARQIHVGMDEVDVGAMTRNGQPRGTRPVEVFLTHLRELREAARRRGATLLVWPDMIARLDPDGQANLLERIPRDVVLCEWQYGASPKTADLERFRAAGGEVWATGTAKYEATNLPNLAYAARKAGARGLIGSTWNSFGPLSIPQEARAVSSLLLAGEYGWTVPDKPVTQTRWNAVALTRALLAGIPPEDTAAAAQRLRSTTPRRASKKNVPVD